MTMMMRCNVSIIQQAITSLSRQPCMKNIASPIVIVTSSSKRLFSSEQPQKPQLYSRLHPPSVIYSDNHLLVINKPAGWHAVPNIPKQRNDDYDNNNNNNNNNNYHENKKCLLSYLQDKQLGGGSKNDFLVPLHRIDQPCTGILLFGKTSKAASRVTKIWKGKKIKNKNKDNNDNSDSNENNQKHPQFIRGVTKDYLCVVPTSRLVALEDASKQQPDNDTADDNKGKKNTTQQLENEWNCLEGAMLKQSSSSSRRNQGRIQHEQEQQYQQRRPDSDHVLQQQNKKGRSVVIVKRRQPQQEQFNNNDNNGVDNDEDNDNSDSDNQHQSDASYVRPVSIKWKKIMTKDDEMKKPEYTLILVRTSEGARHMVRALLAQVGNCPIMGDVRYWTPSRYSNDRPDSGGGGGGNNNGDDFYSNSSSNTTGNTNQPLMDKSVALHAYGVYFDNPNQKLKLGTLNTFEFRAPIPSTWKTYFGFQNVQLS